LSVRNLRKYVSLIVFKDVLYALKCHKRGLQMRIIIVTGLYRSGTTFLQKILDAHHKITIINQGVFDFFKLLDNEYHYINSLNKSLAVGVDLKFQEQKYKRIFEDIYLSEEKIETLLLEIEKHIDSDGLKNNFKTLPTKSLIIALKAHLTPGKAKHVFEQIMLAIKDYREDGSTTILGFKELNLEQFSEALFYSFGDKIRIVQIVRDPRAILSSRNYGSYLREGGAKNKHPLLFILKMWKIQLLYRDYLIEGYNNFYSLFYENLVSDTEREVELLCNFIGVEYDKNMIDANNFKNEEGGKWKPNTSFKTEDRISRRFLDQWKDKVPNDALGAFEFLCHRELENNNYTVCFDKKDQLKYFSSYSENLDNIINWLKIDSYNFDFQKNTRDRQVKNK